jgi:hypothetical protein
MRSSCSFRCFHFLRAEGQTWGSGGRISWEIRIVHISEFLRTSTLHPRRSPRRNCHVVFGNSPNSFAVGVLIHLDNPGDVPRAGERADVAEGSVGSCAPPELKVSHAAKDATYDGDEKDDFYFNYVQRRQRRDVDDVVVQVGSRRHGDEKDEWNV